MRVWLLNFDADAELSGHATSSANAQAMQHALTERVTRLVGADLLFDPKRIYERGTRGFSFMPTPSALAAFARANVTPVRGPSFDVLRRVNARSFSAKLGVLLAGHAYVQSAHDAVRVLSTRSASGEWVLRRDHGFAGKGAKRVLNGPLEPDTRAFVQNSLRTGGLEIAPWVSRTLDASLHGYLCEDGTCIEGEPTVAICDRFGQWQRTERDDEGALSTRERTALRTALTEAAHALHEARYFGPFGIDAFRYALPDGEVHFCPRCEINARYTMGWAIGMGNRRPDLE